MGAERVVLFLVIGIGAGFLAGKIMKGSGYGLTGDLIVGVIGSFLGAWASGLTGVAQGNIFSALAAGIAGALLLLFIIRPVKSR